MSEEQLATFRERAVPEPGNVLRQAVELTNDARLDIPSTVICTAFSADEYRDAVKAGYDFVLGLQEVRNITWVELPTSHWPMWSAPRSSPRSSAGIATEAGARATAGVASAG